MNDSIPTKLSSIILTSTSFTVEFIIVVNATLWTVFFIKFVEVNMEGGVRLVKKFRASAKKMKCI
jgi:hypothetical protein